MIYEVKISAENQAQAETILHSLLRQKLVTGGQFITAPVRFGHKTSTLQPGDVCFIGKDTTYEMRGTFKAVTVNQPAFGSVL